MPGLETGFNSRIISSLCLVAVSVLSAWFVVVVVVFVFVLFLCFCLLFYLFWFFFWLACAFSVSCLHLICVKRVYQVYHL